MGKRSYWKSLGKNILRKGEIRAPEWPRSIKSINGGGWSDPTEERRSSCMMKTWGVDGAFLQWAFFRRGVGGQRFLLSQILGGKSGALRIWGSTDKLGVAALVFFSLHFFGDPWRGCFSFRFLLVRSVERLSYALLPCVIWYVLEVRSVLLFDGNSRHLDGFFFLPAGVLHHTWRPNQSLSSFSCLASSLSRSITLLNR